MKKIYFIRHAKSIHDGVTEDFDRDLNARGNNDAKQMGKRLKKMKIKPDAVFASAAKRTLKTAFLICDEVGFKQSKIKQEKSLYATTPEFLINFVKSLDDELKSVFLVCHNEEITEACDILSSGKIGHIPTCGIVGFECKKWDQIDAINAKMLFFDYPNKV